MRFAKIMSAQNHMLKAHPISVEIDISSGLHSFSIVGLPDKAVEEAKDRVSAAIKNSGIEPPKQANSKIVVSLSPADIKKEGTAFDLPIALGYLLASEEIDFDPAGMLFVGELALDGSVRPVDGTLSYARMAERIGIKELYVPEANAPEASLIKGVSVYGIASLSQAISHLDRSGDNKTVILRPCQARSVDPSMFKDDHSYGLEDIIGQETAKRGLIIAAAGIHNIALFGPPGTGKTMLARALRSILPPLSFEEMLEVTEIHSIAGRLQTQVITRPPVRSPHHTASYVSLVGGGATPKPGEVTLAHRGILFLDEFPEFDKRVIESLRQPLEDKIVSISRAKGTAQFPAHFILIAALNPCPCGNRGIKGKRCSCAPKDIARYERKISGPIMDRIDIWIEVSKVEHEKLLSCGRGVDETASAKEKVRMARQRQAERFKNLGMDALANSSIHPRDMARACEISDEARDTLNQAARTYDLSGRGYHRTIKLARTIADIDGSEKIESIHILEALQYRQKQFKVD